MAQHEGATRPVQHTAEPASARAASRPVRRATFGRAHHLRSSADFARVRQGGRSYRGTHLALGALRRSAPTPSELAPGAAAQPVPATRVGFTVGKRVGGAVARNLVRRRLREAVRLRLMALAAGWDLVVVAHPSAAGVAGTQLAHELETLLVRAKVLEPGSERRSV